MRDALPWICYVERHMSYVVLARKWRPQSFDDLVGQDHVSTTIGNAIAQNRVAHAFLFTGVRGVGKTTSARILAKALNCVHGPTAKPCQVCPQCVEITVGADVDVQEIDGASYNGVDEVRRLQESLPYRPQRDRFKIFIVDEVHMLSNAAWNAFLKTLEEPPPHVKFIFATTEVHKVPVTILSRCQRYDFKLITAQQIASRLRYVLGQEGVGAEDAAVTAIAREAAGSMRDAMSLLDQVIAWVGVSGEKLTAEGVARVLGVADREVLHRLAEAVIEGNAGESVRIVGDLAREGYDLPHVARDFLAHLRDLVIAKVSDDPGPLLDLADAEVADVKALAAKSTADDLTRLHQGFSRAFDDIARSGQPRASLEMTLVRLARRPPLLPVDELLRRLGDLERRLGGGGGGPSAGPPGGGSADRGGPPARGGSPGGAPPRQRSSGPSAQGESGSSDAPVPPAGAAASAVAAASVTAPAPVAVAPAPVAVAAPAPVAVAPAPVAVAPAPVAAAPAPVAPVAAAAPAPVAAAPVPVAPVAAAAPAPVAPVVAVASRAVAAAAPASAASPASAPSPASASAPVSAVASSPAPVSAVVSTSTPAPTAARAPSAVVSATAPTASHVVSAPAPSAPPPQRPSPVPPSPRGAPMNGAAAFSAASFAIPPQPAPRRPSTPPANDAQPRSGPVPFGVGSANDSSPPSSGPLPDLSGWRDVLDRVRQKRPALASVLEHAALLAFGPDRVTLGYEGSSFLVGQATEASAKDLLLGAVRAHFGAATEVSFETIASRSGVVTVAMVDTAERKQKVDAAKRAVVEHPLVTAAIELLGAELRDVKLAADAD